MDKDQSWNSLEVAKLIASLLTPITVAVVGIVIHRVTKRFEHLQWRSQKLIEKRLAVYDTLAPQLNDLLCYFTYIGCWKELEPQEVIDMKRTIDKQVHLAAPLFSRSFYSACMNFQNLCFETFTGWGKDALLRTHFQRRQEARGGTWRTEWNDCFSSTASDPDKIKAAYKAIMTAFADDIGIHPSAQIPQTGRVPQNVA